MTTSPRPADPGALAGPGVLADLEALADLVGDGDVVVLSGAGLSTESGIPDYRGPGGSLRRHTPMTYQAFTGSAAARQRYWARSHVGWRLIARAEPNDGHRAVADLQALGLLGGVVTQNVDGLHQAGGADGVVELHGSLDRVTCLDCGDSSPRDELDERLRAANPDWDDVPLGAGGDPGVVRSASGTDPSDADAAGAADGSAAADEAEVNPDGDVDLPDDLVAGFRPVGCRTCGGTLKPDVVFFGESVPPERVARCYDLVARAGLLLVLGSSLTVMSGHRFVLRAAKLGVPVAIVNQGATRGDPFATVKLDAPLGSVLPRLVRALAGAAGTGAGTGAAPLRRPA